MEYVFGIAATLLLGLVGFRKFEHARAHEVFADRRDALDRGVLRLGHLIGTVAGRTLDFVRRDVLVRTLHLMTYLVLLFVRWLERRLVRTAAFFRRTARNKRVREDADA